MTWQFILWALVMIGIGAVSHALWTASTRHAALRQRLEDKQEMQYLRQREQVEVYAVGGGWACTDAGYIQSKYLCEVEMEEAGLCPVQIAAHGN